MNDLVDAWSQYKNIFWYGNENDRINGIVADRGAWVAEIEMVKDDKENYSIATLKTRQILQKAIDKTSSYVYDVKEAKEALDILGPIEDAELNDDILGLSEYIISETQKDIWYTRYKVIIKNTMSDIQASLVSRFPNKNKLDRKKHEWVEDISNYETELIKYVRNIAEFISLFIDVGL